MGCYFCNIFGKRRSCTQNNGQKPLYHGETECSKDASSCSCQEIVTESCDSSGMASCSVQDEKISSMSHCQSGVQSSCPKPESGCPKPPCSC